MSADTAAVTATAHVVLIGDSTLDNLIWVKNQVKDSVIGALRRGAPTVKVTNFACDGFTSSDILTGNRPMLSASQWRNVGEPFPGCEKRTVRFRPLDALRDLQARQPISHVVLSVGGNDIREILRQMDKLAGVIASYHSNYTQIVQRICGVSSKKPIKLILMLQYRPSVAMDVKYGVYHAIGRRFGAKNGDDPAALLALNQLMKTIYTPVLALAKKLNLAIIDLPRTFDPHDCESYTCQIEPSSKGSEIIASMIRHVLQSHDFSGPSRMYSKNVRDGPGAKVESALTNPSTWSIDRYNMKRGGGSIPARTTPVASAESPLAPPQCHAVKQLMDMGFTEKASKDALAKTGNLPQRAIDLLLKGCGGRV